QPPDDHAPQRLAANVLWITDTAAVEKHATPVANRITRQGSEPEGHRGGHTRNGCSSSPEATSQEQIQDEESRYELDAGCNADPESLPAVAVCQWEVQPLQEHQDQVQLSKQERQPHRGQPACQRAAPCQQQEH